MEATRAIATILSILLVALLLLHSPKVIESLKAPSLGSIDIRENPQFLWVNRGLDLFIQAFLMLSATAGISALLRREERAEEVGKR